MTLSGVWDFSLQTVNAVEGVDLRLQRIKQEVAVIEQHNEKLEKQEENVLNKESANSAADQEVCDVIKIIMLIHAFQCLLACQYNTAS